VVIFYLSKHGRIIPTDALERAGGCRRVTCPTRERSDWRGQGIDASEAAEAGCYEKRSVRLGMIGMKARGKSSEKIANQNAMRIYRIDIHLILL
jgi:hypothetical protein